MATGKIPAGNATAKAMLTAAAAKSRQEGSLAPTEARAKSAGDGKLAALTAEAYYGQGNYAKAAELYRTALQKGGVDAGEVNTRLGIALAAQGDKAGATAAFDAVKGAPRADLAGFLEGLALDPGIRSSSAPIRSVLSCRKASAKPGPFSFWGTGRNSLPPAVRPERSRRPREYARLEGSRRACVDFAQRERLSGQ
jgi:tetratricopeptide (TPR) repeat protein